MEPCSGTGQRSAYPNRLRAVPASNPATLLGAARDGDERAVELARFRNLADLVTAQLRLDGLPLQVSTNPTVPAGSGDISCYVPGPSVPALAADWPASIAATVRVR